MLIPQRWLSALATFTALLTLLLYLRNDLRIVSFRRPSSSHKAATGAQEVLAPAKDADTFRWSQVPEHYPVTSFVPLPHGDASSLPRIQHQFKKETPAARKLREHRLEAVRGNFTHSWQGYRKYAWGKDEAGPLSGKSYDHFGGWAASLVDGLDTLWVMGLKDEFEEAVAAIRRIDFSNCALQELNVFETIIRYMGGLLGAYDITDGQYPTLLGKAVELGEMVYKAFDTPNRMPITRWDFMSAKNGAKQSAPDGMLVAELGSLHLELTRLAQLTGETKYYDAVKRIADALESQQPKTLLPGLFPILVDPHNIDFTQGNLFTLGGMVDSLYEYMPKAHLLLHGATEQYHRLYKAAMKPIQTHLIYRPMTTDNRDVLIAGQASIFGDDIVREPQAQHLTCFVGGMVGLGSRAFGDRTQIDLARKLTDGCIWAYDVMPKGIMPEIMHATACPSLTGPCPFNESKWHHEVMAWTDDGRMTPEEKIRWNHLPKCIASIDDTRYGLRPEAIESVFVLYRLTGDTTLQDKAWSMFESIVAATETEIGAAALSNCVAPDLDGKTDRMESFWFAETLKYFYLVFEEVDVLSLDEFVLNTEAHPFRWRKASEVPAA